MLYTDASGVGIGACLHVCREGVELPVAFYSRQLRGAERNYSVSELEALAIVSAVHYVYLWGADVTVVTDHEPNLALLRGNSRLNGRLNRMAQRLAGRVSRIKWIPGKELANADGMSRRNWEEEDDDSPGPSPQSLLTLEWSKVSGGGNVGPSP